MEIIGVEIEGALYNVVKFFILVINNPQLLNVIPVVKEMLRVDRNSVF